jgi:hypothetical protein
MKTIRCWCASPAIAQFRNDIWRFNITAVLYWRARSRLNVGLLGSVFARTVGQGCALLGYKTPSLINIQNESLSSILRCLHAEEVRIRELFFYKT